MLILEARALQLKATSGSSDALPRLRAACLPTLGSVAVANPNMENVML